jgi:hypothetical protein
MKLINPGVPFVIMQWDEFEELLKEAPKDKWIYYLHAAGCYDEIENFKLLLTNPENVMSKIFIELEEKL